MNNGEWLYSLVKTAFEYSVSNTSGFTIIDKFEDNLDDVLFIEVGEKTYTTYNRNDIRADLDIAVDMLYQFKTNTDIDDTGLVRQKVNQVSDRFIVLFQNLITLKNQKNTNSNIFWNLTGGTIDAMDSTIDAYTKSGYIIFKTKLFINQYLEV